MFHGMIIGGFIATMGWLGVSIFQVRKMNDERTWERKAAYMLSAMLQNIQGGNVGISGPYIEALIEEYDERFSL